MELSGTDAAKLEPLILKGIIKRADVPKPLFHEDVFWRAFEVLNSRRQYNNGYPLPIDYMSMSTYMNNHGIDDTEMFEEIISRLDLEWIKTANAKINAEQKRQSRKR